MGTTSYAVFTWRLPEEGCKEWFWKVFERNTGMERFNLDTMIQLENFGDEDGNNDYYNNYNGAGDVKTMNG